MRPEIAAKTKRAVQTVLRIALVAIVFASAGCDMRSDPVLDALSEHLHLPDDTSDFRVSYDDVFEGGTAIALYFGDATALLWLEHDE